ncbi:MAG: TM2 domain-containing protein [Microcystaceae cyanobacterium]
MAYPAGKNLTTAYLLWALGFFGVSGVHRFYLGKPVTGTVWIFTWGLFWVGQFIDVFYIPKMVAENEQRDPSYLPPANLGPIFFGQQILRKLNLLDDKLQDTFSGNKQAKKANVSPLHELIDYAGSHGRSLSLAQAMMATGLTADETEKTLQEGMKKGIISIGNEAESGAVRYYFDI